MKQRNWNKTTPEVPEVKEVELNETEAGMLQAIQQEINALQLQGNAVLSVIVKRRGLPGMWKLDGSKLVRLP